jgi:hypothetical protein
VLALGDHDSFPGKLPSDDIERGLGGTAKSNELLVKLRLAGADTLSSEVVFCSSVSNLVRGIPKSMLKVWALFFNLNIDKTWLTCSPKILIRVSYIGLVLRKGVYTPRRALA